MASTLKDRLNADVKTALKAREKDRVATLRLILAAIKQREVDQRIDVDDDGILAILDKMAKQRRESISHYEPAGRDDLVAKESFELDIILSYLPEPLSEEEIDTLVAQAIESANAQGMQDMGRVMGALKADLQGRADMAAVSAKVKQRLSE